LKELKSGVGFFSLQPAFDSLPLSVAEDERVRSVREYPPNKKLFVPLRKSHAMLRSKTILVAMVVATVAAVFVPSQAEAGPLLDWMLGRNRYRRSQPWTYGQANNYNAAAIAASANGNLQPGVCQVNCQRTCQRTVVSYVPQTCYRTQWQRVPVTQYRPVTNSDPCSGCTVTCMRPCTTYTYQAQRVPYTTYRPVYRTETYRVPTTYYTTDCGNVNPGCASCGTGTPTATGAFSNQPTPANQNGTINTTGGYYSQPYGQSVMQTGTNAADSVPSIVDPTSSQRPILQQTIPSNNSIMNVPQLPTNSTNFPSPNQLDWQNEPQSTPADKQARAQIHREWDYTPVRLASYESDVRPNDVSKMPQTVAVEYRSSPALVAPQKQTNPNAIWIKK